MKQKPLSIMHIVALPYVAAINYIAQLYDCGEQSLSVQYVDELGQEFFGCHSYWNDDDYAVFSDDVLRQQYLAQFASGEALQQMFDALSHLHERIIRLQADDDVVLVALQNEDHLLQQLGLKKLLVTDAESVEKL